MTTQGTETEQEQALLDHLYEFLGTLSVDSGAALRLFEGLDPHLASIRRHAAADALREQAHAFRASNRNYLRMMLTYDYGSDAYKLTQARAGQVTADARRLENAAQDLIAEGYEHTCHASWAATRDDPGHGCDNPVEHEGDYCDRHAPEDDDRPEDD